MSLELLNSQMERMLKVSSSSLSTVSIYTYTEDIFIGSFNRVVAFWIFTTLTIVRYIEF